MIESSMAIVSIDDVEVKPIWIFSPSKNAILLTWNIDWVVRSYLFYCLFFNTFEHCCLQWNFFHNNGSHALIFLPRSVSNFISPTEKIEEFFLRTLFLETLIIFLISKTMFSASYHLSVCWGVVSDTSSRCNNDLYEFFS